MWTEVFRPLKASDLPLIAYNQISDRISSSGVRLQICDCWFSECSVTYQGFNYSDPLIMSFSFEPESRESDVSAPGTDAEGQNGWRGVLFVTC